MHQTENIDPTESAISKLFASVELLSSKIDELNERIDFLNSFMGVEIGEGNEKTSAEPPGQLAGLSFNTLSNVLPQKDANDLRAYFIRVLGMFHKYIKSIVLFGSAKTKNELSKGSDIDVAFIVDDTDIQHFTLKELKDRLFIKMAEIARDFSEKIHAQAYPLSEFWMSIIKPNPVILTLLRDGIAVYDTGFFVPIQMLYKSGNILPTKESIDNSIISAEELLSWADDTLSRKLTNDLFNSVVSAGQSVLMELGYMPPTPKELPKILREIAVNKAHLLSNEDVDKVEEIIVWFKKIDHGEISKISGAEYYEKYQKSKELVDKMLKIIEKQRELKGLPAPVINEAGFKDKNETYVPRGEAK